MTDREMDAADREMDLMQRQFANEIECMKNRMEIIAAERDAIQKRFNDLVAWLATRKAKQALSPVTIDLSEFPEYREAMDKVVAVLLDGLVFDGGHHKQWALEQALLCLCEEESVAEMKADLQWEEGIAP